MIISGTACTSISGERSSNSEFATCFASGLGASGVTYQCGYRDMFSVAKPLLSLYENVNKVSQRSLAHRVYRYIYIYLEPKQGCSGIYITYIYILCSVFHCWKITKESNFVKQIDGLRGANTTVNKCVYKYIYIYNIILYYIILYYIIHKLPSHQWDTEDGKVSAISI